MAKNCPQNTRPPQKGKGKGRGGKPGVLAIGDEEEMEVSGLWEIMCLETVEAQLKLYNSKMI